MPRLAPRGEPPRRVKNGGTLLSTAFGFSEQLLALPRIHTVNYRLDRKPERLAELTRLVTAGTIRPIIGAKIPLHQAPRALTDGVEVTGLRGKTIP